MEMQSDSYFSILSNKSMYYYLVALGLQMPHLKTKHSLEDYIYHISIKQEVRAILLFMLFRVEKSDRVDDLTRRHRARPQSRGGWAATTGS